MDSATAAAAAPALLAKGALRRLAAAKLEPTPDNYARAYAEQAGQGAAPASDKAQAQVWATLIERLARGLERGGKQWTLARKKDSLQRVLDGSRSDLQRLLQRLQPLVTAWDADTPLAAADGADALADDALALPDTAAASAPVAAVPGWAADASAWSAAR